MVSRVLAVVMAAFFSSSNAYSNDYANTLRGVDVKNDGNEITVVYSFAEEARVEFVNFDMNEEAVEVVFKESNMTSDKNEVPATGAFTHVATAVSDSGRLSSKIFFKEKGLRSATENAIQLSAAGNSVFLKINSEKIAKVGPARESENPVVADAASTIKVTNQMPEKTVTDTTANKKEASIPVLTGLKNAKSSGESTSSRLIFGLIVIFVMSAGLIYFSKWYAQRGKKSTDPNRIRIISQHYLGPRKSLAIVRVAGESLLIGITDHNINIIKSLAMIDEEEAETGISSFKNTLMNTNQEPIEEDFVTQTVTDKITNKLKGMRPI